MEFIDDSYTAFNLIEGLFWICLGLLAFGLSGKVSGALRQFALVNAANLALFGVSDIVEAFVGSFFEPGREWLFVWKGINVAVLVCAVPWYLAIRFREHRSAIAAAETQTAQSPESESGGGE